MAKEATIKDDLIKVSGSKRNLKLGDYVLLTRWSDRDINDPWRIGYLGGMVTNERNKTFYKTTDDNRYYENCIRIKPEDGIRIIELYRMTWQYARDEKQKEDVLRYKIDTGGEL